MKRNCDLITISHPKNLVPVVVETKPHISLQEPPDLPYSSPSEDAPLFSDSKPIEEKFSDTSSTYTSGTDYTEGKGSLIKIFCYHFIGNFQS